jgi:biofilm PGA synthesis N-glycosyltransferase PgaC
MIGYRAKKFYTVTNSEFIVGGVASTYRRETMKSVQFYDTDTQTEDIGLSMKIVAQGNREQRIIYGANVLAMTEGVQTFKALLKQRYRWKLGMMQNLFRHTHLIGSLDKRYSKMLTLYRMPMAILGELMLLLQPIVLAYILYLSVHYQTTLLFVGAYLTITVYILMTVWPDEHSSIRRKLSLSAYAPVMYFIFYIMDFVQIIAIVRVLANPKKVLGISKTDGSWVSPERSGQPATFA